MQRTQSNDVKTLLGFSKHCNFNSMTRKSDRKRSKSREKRSREKEPTLVKQRSNLSELLNKQIMQLKYGMFVAGEINNLSDFDDESLADELDMYQKQIQRKRKFTLQPKRNSSRRMSQKHFDQIRGP